MAIMLATVFDLVNHLGGFMPADSVRYGAPLPPRGEPVDCRSAFHERGRVRMRMIPRALRGLLASLAVTLVLSAATGCGSLTGIPSHGGGKRFAVEQRLIAESARAAIKNLDVSSLRDKRIVLRIGAIGDQGAGNLTGGRYSIESLVRGAYVNTPQSVTDFDLPVRTTKAVTMGGGLTSETVAENVINAPTRAESSSEGPDVQIGLGVRGGGLGDYVNSTLITNAGDINYLLNLLQTYFYLKGIDITTPDQAETAVFITVDVYGTIRRRDDLLVMNRESLTAQTSLELMAINIESGEMVLPPQSSAFEAEYTEKFVFWNGPVERGVQVKPAEPLLVTFEDVTADGPTTRTKAASRSTFNSSAPRVTKGDETDVRPLAESGLIESGQPSPAPQP